MFYFPYKTSINESIKNALKPHPKTDNSVAGILIEEEVVDGIHLNSGLVYDKNFKIVKSICTRCHSAKLITQNKATRQGWKDMIDWMQKTQGLEDLGEFEVVVLDYLSTHYSPKHQGRRAHLETENIQWYMLDLTKE